MVTFCAIRDHTWLQSLYRKISLNRGGSILSLKYLKLAMYTVFNAESWVIGHICEICQECESVINNNNNNKIIIVAKINVSKISCR